MNADEELKRAFAEMPSQEPPRAVHLGDVIYEGRRLVRRRKRRRVVAGVMLSAIPVLLGIGAVQQLPQGPRTVVAGPLSPDNHPVAAPEGTAPGDSPRLLALGLDQDATAPGPTAPPPTDPEQPAGRCSGTLVDGERPYRVAGQEVAMVTIYWDESEHVLCAKLIKRVNLDQQTYLALTLCSDIDVCMSDRNYYAVDAGPVRVSNETPCALWTISALSADGATWILPEITDTNIDSNSCPR